MGAIAPAVLTSHMMIDVISAAVVADPTSRFIGGCALRDSRPPGPTFLFTAAGETRHIQN